MGYPHPNAYALQVPRGVGAELRPARRPKGGREAGARIVSVMLAMLLAVTMLPAAGLSPAFADEPAPRPATSGGDVALESTNGAAGGAAAAPQVPAAETREDGMHVADGLVYTVADGGLALAGFDGDASEGVLAVPSVVSVDGKDASVVGVDIAEGQTADAVTILSLPQGVKDINVASLAPAFPSLASVEVAGASSSLPVAAGAASVRAAYSTSGGMLFRPTSVTVQNDDGSIESIECKELLWAPPALVSARIPIECRAVAEGAFADVRDLKTVVVFGTMERISDGAFSVEQMEAAMVVVPASSPAVTDDERVSASMALMGEAGQKERRRAWHEAGWRSSDIVMGKPCGSLTEAVAVTDEGQIERDELQLVSYPGAHERAMDLKKPNADGVVEQAESGLAFTVKSDMTASVAWQGDKTATPSHLDIPSSVVIDGVTYPVTEIAPSAFEGAAFLVRVKIPEGVIVIGQDAFKDCTNLAETTFPSTLRETASTTSIEFSTQTLLFEEDASNHSTPPQADERDADVASTVTPYAGANEKIFRISYPGAYVTVGNLAGFTVPNTWRAVDGKGMDYIMYAFWDATPDLKLSDKGGNILTVEYGSSSGTISFTGKNGYNVSGYSMSGASRVADNGVQYYVVAPTEICEVTVHVAPDVSGLATTASLDAAKTEYKNLASAAQTAANNAQSTANTNKANIEAINSSFGAISYRDVDASDTSVYPTSYRKGGTPALPTPVKEGFQFTGWSWTRGGASGGSSNIATAFAEAGTVTLTANWVEATPEGNCFFAGSPLDSAVSGAQTHVIAVKLTGDASKTALKSVTFVGNDSTDLIADAQEGAVTFALGTTPDNVGSGGTATWGQELSGTIPLGDVDGGKGLYIKITIPDGAVNKDNVVGSFTADEYVASLVRLDYSFA